jgi:serine/threonine protein kinase
VRYERLLCTSFDLFCLFLLLDLDILLTSRPFVPLANSPSSFHLDLNQISTPFVKLTDFGLSRFIDPAQPVLETRCGSEEYAAPELILGRAYDGRQTDSWALGVVLYALACGHLPFTDDTQMHHEVPSFGRSDSGSRRVSAGRVGGGVGGGGGAGGVGGGGQGGSRRRGYLLRIAKADYEWPNEGAVGGDRIRALVARLLVRNPQKRATVDDVWQDEWMIDGDDDEVDGGMEGRGRGADGADADGGKTTGVMGRSRSLSAAAARKGARGRPEWAEGEVWVGDTVSDVARGEA